MARVNLLCVAGALLGLMALFLPWLFVVEPVSSGGGVYYPVREWDFIDLAMGYWDPDSLIFENLMLFVFAMVFLGGFVASFATPLGGAVQLAGVILISLEAEQDLILDEFGWGLRLAALFSIIVLVSFFVPVSAGYVQRPYAFRNRARAIVLRKE
ncbi:MAG: hypothetical protein A3K67_00530 [Euryarchaeota archaeon RBG_16_62_10]|nr:MAG: hypothetical protein A3K67_00530 [Euryarchaeota archaeon RBG_16_62_10]